MNKNTLHLSTWPFMALVFLLSTATLSCKDSTPQSTPDTDNPPTDTPKSDGPTDDQGRPIIPCTGDLCYPGTDTFDFESIFGPPGTDDDGNVRDYKPFKEIGAAYAACNYQHDEQTGLIRVDCPDWAADSYGCPGHFFEFYDGVLVLPSTPNIHYCAVDDDLILSCANTFRCENGKVCTGSLNAKITEGGGSARPNCLDVDPCLTIANDLDADPKTSCFYADFSRATDTAIAEQDCDALAPGTCAINCPCDNTGRGEDTGKTPRTCQFLSEDHPVGLCASDLCNDPPSYTGLPSDCVNGGVCAAVQWPDWAKDYSEARRSATVWNKKTQNGACVPKNVCEQWATNNPGVITCGASLPDMNPEP